MCAVAVVSRVKGSSWQCRWAHSLMRRAAEGLGFAKERLSPVSGFPLLREYCRQQTLLMSSVIDR